MIKRISENRIISGIISYNAVCENAGAQSKHVSGRFLYRCREILGSHSTDTGRNVGRFRIYLPNRYKRLDVLPKISFRGMLHSNQKSISS